MIFSKQKAELMFKQLEDQLTKQVLENVGNRLISEGKKHQTDFLKALADYKVSLKEEIVEELSKN